MYGDDEFKYTMLTSFIYDYLFILFHVEENEPKMIKRRVLGKIWGASP